MQLGIVVLLVVVAVGLGRWAAAEDAGAGGGVVVEVGGVIGGFESVPKYSVILKMQNAGDAACAVTRYRLRWDGGEKVISLAAPLVIEAGQAAERRAALGDYLTGAVSEAEAKRRAASLSVEVVCAEDTTPAGSAAP